MSVERSGSGDGNDVDTPPTRSYVDALLDGGLSHAQLTDLRTEIAEGQLQDDEDEGGARTAFHVYTAEEQESSRPSAPNDEDEDGGARTRFHVYTAEERESSRPSSPDEEGGAGPGFPAHAPERQRATDDDDDDSPTLFRASPPRASVAPCVDRDATFPEPPYVDLDVPLSRPLPSVPSSAPSTGMRRSPLTAPPAVPAPPSSRPGFDAPPTSRAPHHRFGPGFEPPLVDLDVPSSRSLPIPPSSRPAVGAASSRPVAPTHRPAPPSSIPAAPGSHPAARSGYPVTPTSRPEPPSRPAPPTSRSAAPTARAVSPTSRPAPPAPPMSRPAPLAPPTSRPAPPTSRPAPPTSRPAPPTSRPGPPSTPTSRPAPPTSRSAAPGPPTARPGPRADLEMPFIDLDMSMGDVPLSAPTPRSHDALAIADSYLEALGGAESVPRLSMPLSQLTGLTLGQKAGFLVAAIDGSSSIDDLIDISGLARVETLRILYELLQKGVVVVGRG